MEIKNYLSLGLGVQSTWLYYASSFGYIQKFDAAIFADPGKEKKKTMEYLNFLQEWASKNSDIPIIIADKKSLYRDLLKSTNSTGGRFSAIPAFTKGEDGKVGMLRRQCTNEYKIEQVDGEIRQLLGLKRIDFPVNIWKGITVDEIDRMSVPEQKWKVHIYPMCGYKVTKKGGAVSLGAGSYKMSRSDVVQQYLRHGLPIPPKSSCTFCPFQSEASWRDQKENEPEDWAASVAVDNAIRDSSVKGTKNPIYLHESLMPLEKIEFTQSEISWGNCSDECNT